MGQVDLADVTGQNK